MAVFLRIFEMISFREHKIEMWVLLGVIFFVSGWFDWKVIGSKSSASIIWAWGIVVVSTGIGYVFPQLGIAKWPLALFVFALGMCILYAFWKKQNRNP